MICLSHSIKGWIKIIDTLGGVPSHYSYGVLLSNYWIIVPNVIGLLSGLFYSYTVNASPFYLFYHIKDNFGVHTSDNIC
jgi:hypothetical protein